MESTVRIPPESATAPATKFLSLLKVAAPIGLTAGGLLLHLIGSVRQLAYLHTWHIDPELFPKTTERILIDGYAVVVNEFIGDFGIFVGGSIALFLVIALYAFVLDKVAGRKTFSFPILASRWSPQPWMRDLTKYLAVAGFLSIVVIGGFSVIISLMVLPRSARKVCRAKCGRVRIGTLRKGLRTSRTIRSMHRAPQGRRPNWPRIFDRQLGYSRCPLRR